MKLIKPSFEIWEQPSGLEGVYKQIEHIGRVCYKSEDKMTEDSAKPFVDRMVKSGHGAMLEHGTVYLERDSTKDNNLEWAEKYILNPYARVSYGKGSHRINGILHNTAYVTTNYRVLIEGDCLSDLQYICEPAEYHEKRVTVHFVCDRGVSHEFVRHRVFSFAQESTRYCNYSNDKFGNEITFILPPWVDDRQLGEQSSQELLIQMGRLDNPTYSEEDLQELYFLFGLANSEIQYFNLINSGWKPQEARAVLPNSLKTELVMTGFISDWKHFFRLRTSIISETGKPHPQASELADPLYKKFIKEGYMESLI